jgi:diguanylate cyclase
MSNPFEIHEEDNLDRLCELIMDELKNLSATGQGLTLSSLHKALASKAERLDLPDSEPDLKEIKDALARVLAEFNLDPESQFSEQLSGLLRQIRNAESFKALYRLQNDITDLVQSYRTAIREENRELSGLVIEISTQLIEVERRCLSLIEKTTLSCRTGTTFNRMVATEIYDFEQTAESCQSLAEIKNLVKVKLDTIKSALEAKKTEDQVQQQRFGTEIEDLRSNLKEMQTRVDRDRIKRKSLEQEILVDPLTGIANRRAIERHLKKAIRKCQQYRNLFSMIFIDIDDFKKVNDTYGHWVGDKCIKKIVSRIKPIIRENDFIARYGGDEFIVVLPGTDRRAAQIVANKLSNTISRTRFLYQSSEIKLSVSIGLTQMEETDHAPEIIFSRADAALYEAKSQGKNRVIVV